MAFSALKPCSRIMRASPHQSDQQQQEKEASFLLQDDDNEDEGDHVASHRTSSSYEDPLQQLLPCNPSNRNEVPTFVAHQRFHTLHPHQKKDLRTGVIKHSGPFSEDDAFSQGFLVPTLPASEFHKDMHRVCSVHEPLNSKPQKQNAVQDHHNKKTNNEKIVCVSNNTYGLALEQDVSVREVGGEKKRRSIASTRDVINAEEMVSSKERFCDVKSSSWEEEVRQAMARSSMGTKQSEEAHKGGQSACGLQKSISVKDYASSAGGAALPPTLIVKRTSGGSKADAATCKEAGAMLMQDIEMGGRPLQRNSFAGEKGMWRGFNVKSPSEERWEEAAEDEERQEMQRRARSQSMRYDSSRAAERANIGGYDAFISGNCSYNDEEWAVYRRSGYVHVRPRSSSAVAAPCCSSLLGRSLSMRDTRMGLVLECAACGAGGQLLCFCSCCAAARASTQGTPSIKKKGGGAGILRACRRLFGLGKKRVSNPQL